MKRPANEHPVSQFLDTVIRTREVPSPEDIEAAAEAEAPGDAVTRSRLAAAAADVARRAQGGHLGAARDAARRHRNGMLNADWIPGTAGDETDIAAMLDGPPGGDTEEARAVASLDRWNR